MNGAPKTTADRRAGRPSSPNGPTHGPWRRSAIRRRLSLGSTPDALYGDRTRALLLAEAGELSAAFALINQVVATVGGADGDAAPVLRPTQAQLELSLGHVEKADRLVAADAGRFVTRKAARP